MNLPSTDNSMKACSNQYDCGVYSASTAPEQGEGGGEAPKQQVKYMPKGIHETSPVDSGYCAKHKLAI